MRAPWICSFLFACLLIFSSIATQPLFSPTADISTTWTNHESSLFSVNFTDGSSMRVILVNYGFISGFFCNRSCTSYLFAIVIDLLLNNNPQLIWSANRDHPVREGAILNLTASGGLVLKDVDGSMVWTTNTNRKSVAGLNLTDEGNLVLFDGQNSTVWQSFDHPTDSLLRGQKLFEGQKLIPSVSSTNWTAQKDLFYLQVTNKGLFAYVGSNPPQAYYSFLPDTTNTDTGRTYVGLFNESGDFYFNLYTAGQGYGHLKIDYISEFSPQYIKLMPDGHLKAFRDFGNGGPLEADILTIDGCYPLSCGRNAICLDSANQQCICPFTSSSLGTDYFKPVDRQPNKGCFPVTPLTCNDTQDQHFIQLENVKYFPQIPDIKGVDVDTCIQACRNNCSCKAALFWYYDSNSSDGNCSLPSELFTMTSFDVNVNDEFPTSTFLKVQNRRSSPSFNMSQTLGPSPTTKNQITTVVGLIVGSLVLIVILVVGFTKFIIRRKKMDSEMEEEYLDQVPGMPTRFSYEELKTATDNFSKKLGEGGFGSVFQGTLEDGTTIAVKCLQGLAHVKKSFLAEVESIGSIHHVNLVRLRGFCAWKSERLLVYEFMSNGSLDQWIYSGDRKHILGWECRKKIILDIAKGLAYLHEDCRQKIIHLDIKPQNILLDEEFNAKVADFGLSKLIDRDQSQVMTTMRGTPGYLAPEWLSSFITEKVDVYSFGILLLEILCGRKIFDRCQPQESWHLLCVFQRCWEQGTLLNIVDRSSEDMQVHGEEVMEMMKVASWCLQTEFTKRPSMSTVIKVLEGAISVELNLDYNFSDPRVQKAIEHEKSSKSVLPSMLSGAR